MPLSFATPKAKKIRYAVVGLGYISQVAVLPAFKNARANSELVALISSDHEKMRVLAKKYDVAFTATYAQFEDCLREAQVDVVYIALPNSLHKEYTLRAAKVGVHVLCEKPLAVTEDDAREMIAATQDAGVKLMTAYRLHFEAANLEAVQIVKSGQLGEPKLYQAAFSMQVEKGNIRLEGELGGGAIYDLGIYALNAARYIFQDDPVEVMAMSGNTGDKRFVEVDEMTSVLMRFRGEKLATFTTSFAATDASWFEVLGTKGRLRVEPAFNYAQPLKHSLTLNGKTTSRTFKKCDQFAAELLYFSNCVLHDKKVEPDGYEGLADIKIIEAILKSARTGHAVRIDIEDSELRPSLKQKIVKPPVRKPPLIHSSPPSNH